MSAGVLPKSKEVISKEVDKTVDREQPSVKGTGGISVRNGPVEDLKATKAQVNGHTDSKRKSRPSNAKSYKDASDSDDDLPLVSFT